MKNKLFDNHVKEQLAGLKPQVPSHIWENIVAANRKKPAGFWRFFTGANIAAAVLVLLITGSLTRFLARNNTNITVTTQSGRPAAAHEPVKNNIQNNNFEASRVATPPAGGDNNNSSSNGNTVLTGVSDALINPSYAPVSIRTSAKSDFSINSSNANDVLIGSDNINSINSITNNIPAPDLTLQSRFSYAQLLKNNVRLNPALKMPWLPRNPAIPCPKAERDAAGNKKYVEVYGGPDYSFTNISDSSAAYAQQRRTSAKTSVGYSAGIRYTKVFSNGMSIRTGLNYSRINENFTAVQGHVTRNVYITDNAGDTTGSYSVTGTQYTKSVNKFSSIDIPLMAGYEAGNGRLHTNINAGVIVNIRSRESGFVEDKSGRPVDISTGTQKTIYQYRTNTGLGLATALSVYYKLNERLHILAEPYFRYSLSTVTQSTISLKQKYHTAGLRLGLRVDL